MDAKKAVNWSLKVAQDAAGADAADANQEAVGKDLPPAFGAHLGVLAILNYSREKVRSQATQYGLTLGQLEPILDNALDTVATQNGITQSPQFKIVVSTLPGGVDGVRFRNDGDVTTIYDLLKEEYNNEQADNEMNVSMQYSPEPTGKGTQTAWTNISSQVTQIVRQQAEALRATQVQPANAPTAWSKKNIVTAQQEGPLSAGRYESIDQLKQDLITMGPKPETYARFMSMVGPDREDDAKDALGSFFQGLAASVYTLYDLLVSSGLASPIDADIVENLMIQHPEKSQSKDGEGEKVAGLFLPPLGSGIETKIEKTAGGMGGAYNAYTMYGPEDNRMCPKLRAPVSTFICRYHCLDGLNIDDHQTLCGEAIWRQAVMDKFSRPYRDDDGKWVGGYLEKRFETHHDDGGHPAMLKPGTRWAPIHEDAWSTEKRLQEMRRTEGKTRGYCETPGDPKGLYNFDQHEIMGGGPKNPQLSEMNIDPLAKIADSLYDSEMIKIAADDKKKKDGNPFANAEWAKPGSEEGIPFDGEGEKVKDDPSKEDLKDADEKEACHAGFNLSAKRGKKKEIEKADKNWNPNPWAVCHTTVDKDSNPDKFERCVHDIKDKQAAGFWSLTKEAWGEDMMQGGGDKHDAMGDNTDMGVKLKMCLKCKKRVGVNKQTCEACGGNQFKDMYDSDIMADTGAIRSPNIMASSQSSVVFANGIYKASKNGTNAYGDTAQEAMEKLAQMDLADTEPGTVDQEADQLVGLRQDTQQESVPAPLNVTKEPTAEAAPAPAMDPTPSTPGVPVESVPPVPEEVQGGKSEFATDGGQQAMQPSETAPAGDIFLNEDDLEGTTEGHVAADELDKHLGENAGNVHPDDMAEAEQQAIQMGAHPRG